MDLLRGPLCFGAVLHVLDQDGELARARARQRVTLPQALAQPLADLQQQLVASGAPEPIVQRLEGVDGEQEDREPLASAAPHASERSLDQVEEVRAVRQERQRVVQTRLDRPGLGDVHRRSGEAHCLARGVTRGLSARQHPPPAPILVPQAVLALEAGREPVEVHADGRLHRLAVPRVDAVDPFGGRLVLCLRSNDGAPRLRKPQALAVQVPVPDTVAGRLAGSRIAVAQRVPLLDQRRVADLASLAVSQRDDGPFAHPGPARACRRRLQMLLRAAARKNLAERGPRPRRLHVDAGEDDHRQLPAHGLGGGEPEHLLCGGVPRGHLPIRVADQRREGSLIEQPRGGAHLG